MNDELNCSQAELLTAAYALDSLEGEERCSFLAHLAECRLHDEELAGYRMVSSRLPSVIDSVAPPSQLRNSLLRNFDAAVRVPDAPDPRPNAAPRRGGFGFFRKPAFAYGLAAALAVVAIALGAFALTRSSNSNQHVTQLASAENGRSLQVTYIADKKVGVIDLNLPPLNPNRAYQLWEITAAGPVSLGLVTPSGSTAFNGDLSKATALAITEEPAGGSAQPTTTPFLVTKISIEPSPP